ncbi:unnamed protein product [Protopolystoma xenopodis]|uniref:Uncharacterized protein n=1 Tax=Protopolystoma xenopodis TaxID=117903 RepID=A0A3S5B6E1_9PLAT|nr:unnamed protein product [Protopolystoma xenopodis]
MLFLSLICADFLLSLLNKWPYSVQLKQLFQPWDESSVQLSNSLAFCTSVRLVGLRDICGRTAIMLAASVGAIATLDRLIKAHQQLLMLLGLLPLPQSAGLGIADGRSSPRVADGGGDFHFQGLRSTPTVSADRRKRAVKAWRTRSGFKQGVFRRGGSGKTDERAEGDEKDRRNSNRWQEYNLNGSEHFETHHVEATALKEMENAILDGDDFEDIEEDREAESDKDWDNEEDENIKEDKLKETNKDILDQNLQKKPSKIKIELNDGVNGRELSNSDQLISLLAWSAKDEAGMTLLHHACTAPGDHTGIFLLNR